MQSNFDPNLLLSATTEQVNVKRPPLPVENPAENDGLYMAQIGEVKVQSGTMEKGERAGQPWASLLIPLKIDVPQQLQTGLGLPAQVTITDRVFLDLTPEGGIDNGVGKNRGQRLYRDALGLNKPGQPFSWQMVVGQILRVKVAHEMYEGEPVERIGLVKSR